MSRSLVKLTEIGTSWRRGVLVTQKPINTQNLCVMANHVVLYFCLQPKGADRKHKTDREKMEKRTEAEKVSIVYAFIIEMQHVISNNVVF